MQWPTEPQPIHNLNPFAELVETFHQSLLPLNSPSISATASPMTRPATYSGELDECNRLLLQCSSKCSQLIANDWAEIAFSLLSGWALQWARVIWNANGPVTNFFMVFVSHFKEVFSQTVITLSVHDQLFRLLPWVNTHSNLAYWQPLVAGMKPH